VGLIGTKALAQKDVRVELSRLHIVFDDEDQRRWSGARRADVPRIQQLDDSGATKAVASSTDETTV
jgi:hypothetical protein